MTEGKRSTQLLGLTEHRIPCVSRRRERGRDGGMEGGRGKGGRE